MTQPETPVDEFIRLVLFLATNDDPSRHRNTVSNAAVQKLALALKCAVEALAEFRLGHKHEQGLEHFRMLGDTYGWCDHCGEKVYLGPDEATLALDRINEIVEGKS